MLVVHDPAVLAHRPLHETFRGQRVDAVEVPERVHRITEVLRTRPEVRWHEASRGAADPTRLHDRDYLEFLEQAWARFEGEGGEGELTAYVWPFGGSDARPTGLHGQLGRVAGDAATAITPGTWEAIRASADCAVTAAELVASGTEDRVLALCRPPGHHASGATFAGYCFLNTAGLAAERLLDAGAERAPILDVDYHHGNGTQTLFEHRPDVPFVSIHADPDVEYPWFFGRADEQGLGAGEGFTTNLPLSQGSGWDRYAAALDTAAETLEKQASDVLVVSLGLDVYVNDPLGRFTLGLEDLSRLGERMAGLSKRLVICLEGGYADDLGEAMAALLDGLAAR